jgi:hypothetical protein
MIALGIVPVHRQNAGLDEEHRNEENLASAIVRSSLTSAFQKCAAIAFLTTRAIRTAFKKIASCHPLCGGEQERVVVP